MSTDLLREAATAMRNDAITFMPRDDAVFFTAVADWLDREAALHDAMTSVGDLLNASAKELGQREVRLQFSDTGDQMAASTMPQAIAVARAYLGRDA